MLNIKDKLIEMLNEKGATFTDKGKYIAIKSDNTLLKIFFHNDDMDMALIYPSTLTESKTRNMVFRALKDTNDIFDKLTSIIDGVETSRAYVKASSEEDLQNILWPDTYNRYIACKSIVDSLSA